MKLVIVMLVRFAIALLVRGKQQRVRGFGWLVRGLFIFLVVVNLCGLIP